MAIYLLNKHILSAYYVPGMCLGTDGMKGLAVW